jgi:hypothetical protein
MRNADVLAPPATSPRRPSVRTRSSAAASAARIGDRRGRPSIPTLTISGPRRAGRDETPARRTPWPLQHISKTSYLELRTKTSPRAIPTVVLEAAAHDRAPPGPAASPARQLGFAFACENEQPAGTRSPRSPARSAATGVLGVGRGVERYDRRMTRSAAPDQGLPIRRNRQIDRVVRPECCRARRQSRDEIVRDAGTS